MNEHPLRQHHDQHQDRGGEAKARRHLRLVRRRQGPGRTAIVYDLVLVAGRAAERQADRRRNAGVSRSPTVALSRWTNRCAPTLHIYAIGDIVGQPMLAHKAYTSA